MKRAFKALLGVLCLPFLIVAGVLGLCVVIVQLLLHAAFHD